jgi:murein DD-endopeptidase MepM/ murein hydrolase activator NlpD
LKEDAVGLELGGRRSRARAWTQTFVVLAAVVALVAPLLSGPTEAFAASRIDYPTWSEVTAARKSEAATKRQVAAITALLAQLETALAQARADEIAKGEAYEAAQNAFDEQVLVTDELVAQADAARESADEAHQQASRLLSMLARAGDGDLIASLLGEDSTGADSFLYRLETMDRLTEQSNSLYTEALQLQNTADSLADQATIAREKRDELQVLAEEALAAARAATVAADEALAEQQDHQAELKAQLAVLVEKRQATEKDYRAGVAAREAARKAREAAERAAAEAAAAANGANSAGWARPATGYISSGYGMRYHPIYHYWRMHNGTDIAGMGCGAPIDSVHAGVVTYAGWNGTLGNYIQVNHGDGTSSGYGHIQSGGVLVRYGQSVTAGQQIARVGSTGASTGCHLHFMIRVNGALTNPVPFMANRGIRLG